MQISTISQSSLWSSLTAPDRQADTAVAGATLPMPTAEAAAPAGETGDVVSLSGNAAAPAEAGERLPGPAAEVFAEIWKDGMKIGVVYTDGQAMLPNVGGATAGNGAMPAYMRAQQISQQVGGEVRLVNIPALQVAQTRAQLQAAYGLRG